jgi:hypothetical protein
MPRRPALHRPLLVRPALHRPVLVRPALGRRVLGRLALGLLALGPCTAPLGAANASAALAFAPARAAEATPRPRGVPVSAVLDQCVTAVLQTERSATFSGEMTAIPGTVRMAMRIEVQERLPAEAAFHTITAAGLGVWRTSDQKVRAYRYLKQVTNLHSPASYRALVRFRWLTAKGRVLAHTERLSPRCPQPASPAPALPGPGGGVEGKSTSSPPAGG